MVWGWEEFSTGTDMDGDESLQGWVRIRDGCNFCRRAALLRAVACPHCQRPEAILLVCGCTSRARHLPQPAATMNACQYKAGTSVRVSN